MKRILMGALLALAGGASAASAETQGVVDLSYRQVSSGSADIDGIGFGGAVSTGLSGNWGAQFDARWLRLDAGSAMTVSSGNAHLFYNYGDWKLGGLLSVEDFTGSGIYGIGVDGQYNFSRASLTGQIVYDTPDNSSVSIWSLGARGRYFFTDNFSADLRYTRTDADSSFFMGDALDTYGIGAEYKFASPVSLFADYQQVQSDGASTDLDSVRVGVRFGFGDGTLLEREKSGPSLLQHAMFAESVY